MLLFIILAGHKAYDDQKMIYVVPHSKKTKYKTEHSFLLLNLITDWLTVGTMIVKIFYGLVYEVLRLCPSKKDKKYMFGGSSLEGKDWLKKEWLCR